ncbi:MAG: hypothetical protein FWE46_06045 [Coriobacteriia bacterium]|nr:hypothetical protein [Coriobacteriia bacterium]
MTVFNEKNLAPAMRKRLSANIAFMSVLLFCVLGLAVFTVFADDAPFDGPAQAEQPSSHYLSAEQTATTDNGITALESTAAAPQASQAAQAPASPLAASATMVSNWASLRAAMLDASVDYIQFANPIVRTGSAGASNDLPVVLRDLTIDGAGFSLDARNEGSSANINRNLFRVGGNNASPRRSLTITDLSLIRPNATSHPAIAFVATTSPLATTSTSSGTRSLGQQPSLLWTINLNGVSHVGEAQSGLVNLPDGSVNLMKQTGYHMNGNHEMIFAREIIFVGGQHSLTNQSTGSSAQIIQINPTTANRSLGADIVATDAAQVYMMTRSVNQVLNADISGRVNVMVSDASMLAIEGHGAGTGASGATLVVNANSGGFDISGGSVLRVLSLREGNGQPAVIQQIPGGIFRVDGADSLLDLQSWGSSNNYGATLRFRYDGDQLFEVTGGARVNIVRHRSENSNDAAALRFGNGRNNDFYVGSTAQVRIENHGNASPVRDPGTARANGYNAAIEYNAAGFSFDVSGCRTAVELIGHRGAALNAKNYADGNINVGEGSIFLARGETASAAASSFQALGGNVHFYMESPLYYDFVNTRPGGGRVFNLGTAAGNTFTSRTSDIAVWISGINDWDGNPARSWTLIDYLLTGAHLRNASSSDASFVDFYDTPPLNSMRIESYTRLSGNNAAPEVRAVRDLTNADRYARVLAAVPEGLDLMGRPVWTGEVWGSFEVTRADTGMTYVVTSQGDFASSLVRSLSSESLFEQQRHVETIKGVVQLRYADGRFLHAGDSYRLVEMWRSETPDSGRRRTGTVGLPSETMTVRDVTPPVPAGSEAAFITISDRVLSGNWELAYDGDNGPTLGDVGIKASVAAGGNVAEAQPLAGTGSVHADGRWDFTVDRGILQAGDSIWIVLIDDLGNENPLVETAYRDAVFPQALQIRVEPEGQIVPTGLFAGSRVMIPMLLLIALALTVLLVQNRFRNF